MRRIVLSVLMATVSIVIVTYLNRPTPLEGEWLSPTGNSKLVISKGWFRYHIEHIHMHAPEAWLYRIDSIEAEGDVLHVTETVTIGDFRQIDGVKLEISEGPAPGTILVPFDIGRGFVRSCWPCQTKNHEGCYGVVGVWLEVGLEVAPELRSPPPKNARPCTCDCGTRSR